MPNAEAAARSPYDVLDRYYQAMLDKSADDLADLYAADALHEFPFATPGFPPSLEGREAVRAGYRASWGASPVQVAEIRRTAVHQTTDPEVIVAEQVVVGTIPATGATFGVPGLLVLRVHDGQISHVRDYIDTSGLRSATV
ncbi:nuclear transport factor 2 family protein [Streptomyces sp. NPDC021020]|uniref:nuclear transport factor 2 family protein n=1 Tax=Streptomyces sp. NPDC021020 TaxID=3365109 RepID=UPI0037BA1BEB